LGSRGPVLASTPTRCADGRSVRQARSSPDSQPLAGASVWGWDISNETLSGSRPNVFGPAVTNLLEEFVVTSNSPINDADLLVEGNGVAPRILPGRKPEQNPQRIVMTAGATLTGRLVRDGKAVPGAAVGLSCVSSSGYNVLHDTSIGTDSDGRFTFVNVHSDDDYFVYGVVGTFKNEGAVDARQVHVGGEGTTRNLGDLLVVRGHRVKGRVILSDGKSVPAKARLLIRGKGVPDSLRVELGRDGMFEIKGLLTARYYLSVRVKGYRLSPKNHSFDPESSRLIGMVDQDIDLLKILLEPVSR
ncbi:MAG: hypothetical protein ACP5XB_31760, partial [Isosphaeraceae bacterium]